MDKWFNNEVYKIRDGLKQRKKTLKPPTFDEQAA